MTNLSARFALGLLPAAALALLSGCAPSKPEAPNAMMMLPKVTVDTPRAGTITNWDEYPGHLEAVESVDVRPRVAGYIESIHFQDGAEVKAGDLLFVIDAEPFQAEFDHAQALRQEAQTRLDLARIDLKRAEGLRATKAISEEEYDTRRNAVNQIEASVAAAKAAETTARINLDYTHIKAPISGKIGRRLVTPGNFVQLQANGGATVLATIVTQQPIYCSFDAQEEVFLHYRDNGAEHTSMPCEIALVNEEGFPHAGTVDFVDNQVDPRTGTIRMRAVFTNADRLLVPGLFANVRVPAGPPVEALLVPDVAIQSDQGHKFVFVANKDGIAEARPVKTGRSHGDMRSILGGLTTSDRVVINGLIMVRPGSKLEVHTAGEVAAAVKVEDTAKQ
jgi:RND family efflux transporter MFP subunit